jgi:hypothetical protein
MMGRKLANQLSLRRAAVAGFASPYLSAGPN